MLAKKPMLTKTAIEIVGDGSIRHGRYGSRRKDHEV
jgi:hypothetical protein